MFSQNQKLPGTADQSGKVGWLGHSANFSVDTERRLVIVRFGRKVSIDVIASYASRLRTHPSFEPTFSEIVDMSATEELDLSADDFLRLADQVDPFSPEAKRAFVVKDSVQRHAARLHKILGSYKKITMFDSIAAAERWIRS